MLELAPAGFEERELGADIELAAYGDTTLERAVRAAFDDVRSTPVEPEWEDRWRAFHRGRTVGELWVGPPWEPPPRRPPAVVIEPGRAFGTGAHATTRLCLELLQTLRPTSVVDVGCGSGVIAVAAARLGFAPVFAIDDDPVAVEATRANAAANDVDVDARVGDARAAVPPADVAIANISLDVGAALALAPATRLLVASGYLEHERLALPQFRTLRRREAEGWAAELLERTG